MKLVDKAGPYTRGAIGYWSEGWNPLPLPPNAKTYPPRGWTGGSKSNSGEPIPEKQIHAWIREQGNGNICLRMPKDVIGIDVDMYDGKAGRETLAAAEEAWGPLPATWRTSSRMDGSGIRLFRIPIDLAWPGKLPQGGGVELCRWDHRYVICAPSVHPDTGDEYQWIDPDGNPTTEADEWEFPAVEELPDLPTEWVEGLTGGKPWVPREETELDSQEVTDWLNARGDNAMCEVMERTLAKHLQELRKAGPEGGAHDAARDGVWAIIGDSAAGHGGLRVALTRMQSAFKEAVKGRRSTAERQKEWRSFIEGGVRKVAAEGEPEEEDICEYAATAHAARRTRGAGSSQFEYTRDDTGNARRFARRYRDNVRYVDALGGWHIWQSNRWVLDTDGEIMRMAMATVSAMAEEAKFIEDDKERSRFISFCRASSNKGRLEAMIEMAKSLKGMTAPAESFNANSRLLVCDNGTLVLAEDGVSFRPSVQEDYNTLTTGVAFVPGQRGDASPYWNKFLERFQPDLEVRSWLQKLTGYSLFGANPARLLIVAYGPTSTGKTTFSLALEAAFGEYGAATSMSVFRDNQDERPRADLVRVLDRRMVYAEEASANWHLHPDQVKRLTGGAPVPARLPHAKFYVERVPAFTPWIFTNHAPTIEHADAALWRRILVVPFSTTIEQTEEDAAFAGKLLTPEGKSAVLAWAVEGWNAYCVNPNAIYNIPGGAVAALEEFRNEVNDTSRFLSECCEFGEFGEYFAKPSQLYDAYKIWAEENGIKERDRANLVTLSKYLTGLGLPKTSTRRYPGKEGTPIPVRGGIRLNARWERVVPRT